MAAPKKLTKAALAGLTRDELKAKFADLSADLEAVKADRRVVAAVLENLTNKER